MPSSRSDMICGGINAKFTLSGIELVVNEFVSHYRNWADVLYYQWNYKKVNDIQRKFLGSRGGEDRVWLWQGHGHLVHPACALPCFLQSVFALNTSGFLPDCPLNTSAGPRIHKKLILSHSTERGLPSS